METERVIFLPGIGHGWVVDEKTYQDFILEVERDNISGVKIHDSDSTNCQLKEILLDIIGLV